MRIPYVKKHAAFSDREVTRWNDILKDWDGAEALIGPVILGVPLSKSSISHSGASFAPHAIRRMLGLYTTYHIEDEQDAADSVLLDCGDIEMHVTNILENHKRIEHAVSLLTERYEKAIPIILGGDHSISFPSISGFAKGRGRVGVIQFDAHHDLRNIEDGGPSNGTPFRNLLEHGVVEGENIIQIGIRNFSNAKAYHAYALAKGVTVYTMKQVRNRAVTDIVQESIEKLRTRVDSIYVSIDMDVLDQACAPGCPAIGPGGLHSRELLEAAALLGKEPLVGAVDIVEIDPTIDFRDMTSRIAAHIVMSFVLERL